jgi:hypothetical protein
MTRMAGTDSERIASLETAVTLMTGEVSSIRTDMKELAKDSDVKAMAKDLVAIRTIVDRRSGFGDAFRTGLPMLLSLVAVIAAIVIPTMVIH